MKSSRYSEKLRIAAGHNVKERDYWLHTLQGELPRSNFPFDKKAIEEYGIQYHMDEMEFKLPAALQEGLLRLSNHSDEALHVVLLAGLVVLLHKYTDNNNILLATPIYREDGNGEFINTVLIIRGRLTDNITFKELLLQVKQEVIAANENANYPIEILVEQLGIKTSPDDEFPPDIVILLDNIHDKDCIHHIEAHTVFYFSRTGRSIEGVLEYNILQYNLSTLERILVHFIKGLQQAVSDVNIKVSHIDILPEEERKRLLFDFNRTDAEYPRDKTIHQLFREQVRQTPDFTALIAREHVTYRQLDERSDGLAHLLRIKGVTTGTIAAIMVERSIEMMVGIFGILKAGGAYLPINPNYPPERIDYILKDSSARVLVSNVNKVNGRCEVIDPDNIKEGKGTFSSSPVTHAPGQMCYVIYTSGSTGRPKGVIIRHFSLVNRLNWMQKAYGIDSGDTLLQKTPFTFDVSVWEIFWWSLVGAKLCLLVPGGEKEPSLIIDTIEKNKVTVVHFVPSMLAIWLEYLEDNREAGRLSCLKQVIASGEVLTLSHVDRFNRLLYEKNSTRLANLYGPTEAAIDVSHFDCSTGEMRDSIPIGKPIDNLQLYVVGKQSKLQPLGVPGELCIGGVGLARGYLNNPELTAEKFGRAVNRLYKTGDLARWLPDGNIEFLGRIDHQVKIRGNRVEPGEIENRLLSCDGIKEAVVIAAGDDRDGQLLYAYFVSTQILSASELREYLAKELPDYMIPAYFIQLEKMPLTSNGKIHRKSLPEPDKAPLESLREYVAPRDPLEEQLVQIWEAVLGRNPIGITENFFMMGGDSIKAIQISSRLIKAGYQVEVEHILRNPTVLKLLPLVKERRQRKQSIVSQSPITGKIPLTPIQEWFFRHHTTAPHHYNMAVLLYSKKGFKEEGLRAVFLKIQEHHDALRMTFKNAAGEIVQINQGLEYPQELQVFDLRNTRSASKKIEEKANEIQAGIDLENGPLMKLALFHLDDGDRLLIVIHHLVMDGFSWRILFEDIETLYQQYNSGRPLKLPPKTDSFKGWSEQLSQYANSPHFLKEKEYWGELVSVEPDVLVKDIDGSNDTADTHPLSFTLEEEQTHLLLTKVNDAFGTVINDILLTALGLALRNTYRHSTVLIALEGHGREDILKDLDVSRTVGWFTSQYPVIIDTSYGNDLSRQIREVKETLRRVPHKGIGYGILKYLTKEEHKKDITFKLKPQICFNYLGQFYTDLKQMSLTLAGESFGNLYHPGKQKDYALEVTGIVTVKQLVISMTYDHHQFKKETIQTLIKQYEIEINRIISYCLSRKERELTPSDLTYPELSIEQVEQLARQYPLEDIYTLSPMQEGILFYVLYNRGTTAYFEQLSYRIHGKLDISIVKRCLDDLLDRYEILRTAFVHKGFERPLQLVLKKREIDLYYESIREKIADGDEETFIKAFKEKDRQQSFDLSEDVLMRVSILQIKQDEYEFIWSFHHILMDGWCIGILIAEFYEVYYNYLHRRKSQLPEVRQYRTYIEWLEKQDGEKSGTYWHKYLDNYKKGAVVPEKKKDTGMKGEYINGQILTALEHETVARLRELMGISEVTLNTIMQTAWGIFLAKYNNISDVVFGAVVSGRPSKIGGIESMVGLFINTIPVRIRYEEETTFTDLLKRRQAEVIAGEPYSYYPLAKIQAASLLKRNLLDHILVFQNYPVSAQLDGIMDIGNNEDEKKATFEFSHVEAFEHSNYDLMVTFYLDETLLKIRFDYNINTYDKEKLEEVLDDYIDVLDQVSENPGIRINDILIRHQLQELESSIFVDEQSDFGF